MNRRGGKYVVVKGKDIDAALNQYERDLLSQLLGRVRAWRAVHGKQDNRYLVVNVDENYAPAVLMLMRAAGHVPDWEGKQNDGPERT